MIARARIPSLVAACLLVVSAGVLSVGCGRQPEGERCSLKNGDLDCNSELKCTPSTNLRNGADGVDRCCPSSTNVQDERCDAGISGAGTGGATSADGGGGEGGTAQGGASGLGLGEVCNYNSNCLLPLVCKTTCASGGTCSNSCQYECNETRDCLNGYVCTNNTCLLDR